MTTSHSIVSFDGLTAAVTFTRAVAFHPVMCHWLQHTLHTLLHSHYYTHYDSHSYTNNDIYHHTFSCQN